MPPRANAVLQEVHDMAEYLGINLLTEGFLLPLAKMSLQVQQRLRSSPSRLPPA